MRRIEFDAADGVPVTEAWFDAEQGAFQRLTAERQAREAERLAAEELAKRDENHTIIVCDITYVIQRNDAEIGFYQRVLPPPPMMAGAVDNGDDNQPVPAAGANGTTNSGSSYRTLAEEFGTPASPQHRVAAMDHWEACKDCAKSVAKDVTINYTTAGAGKAIGVIVGGLGKFVKGAKHADEVAKAARAAYIASRLSGDLATIKKMNNGLVGKNKNLKGYLIFAKPDCPGDMCHIHIGKDGTAMYLETIFPC